MILNLPILPLLLPLLCGLLGVIATPRIRPWLAGVVAILSLLCISALAGRYWLYGTKDYLIGGWPSQLGIVYRVDGSALLILAVIHMIAWGHLPRLFAWVEKAMPLHKQGPCFALYCLCVMGMSGMVLSHDVFHVFVCLEIMSLTAYVLLAASGTQEAVRAAFHYLILGSLGGTLYLLGVGMLYLHTGALNMMDIAVRLLGLLYLHSLQAGVALLLIGLLLKLGVFPVYRWLIQAYRAAAADILPFLAALIGTVNMAICLRYGQTLLPELMAAPAAKMAIEVLGCGTLLAGCAVMYFRPYLRDIVIGSSLLHYGMMLLAMAQDSVGGFAVAWFECSTHAITKFLLLTGLLWLCPNPHDTLTDLRGSGRRMPLLGIVIALVMASQIGIPFTVGFISKWQWLLLMVKANSWHLFALGIVGSLVSLFVYGRLCESLFAKSPELHVIKAMPLATLAVLTLGVCMLMMAGFYGEFTFGIVYDAVAGMGI
jgi:multicomponent Na+:H+ antiporter subunit D